MANAQWTRACCPGCHQHTLIVWAGRDLGRSDEICAATPPALVGRVDGGPLVTFDGESRGEGDARASGAAVVPRSSPDETGAHLALHSAAVALPQVFTFPEVEAWGCRLAVGLLLTHWRPDDGAPVVAGGNLGAV
eukprot:13586547-Alexandrium_andersonii.AAC.1